MATVNTSNNVANGVVSTGTLVSAGEVVEVVQEVAPVQAPQPAVILVSQAQEKRKPGRQPGFKPNGDLQTYEFSIGRLGKAKVLLPQAFTKEDMPKFIACLETQI